MGRKERRKSEKKSRNIGAKKNYHKSQVNNKLIWGIVIVSVIAFILTMTRIQG